MTTWPDLPDREIAEPLDNAYEHAALIIDSDDALRARLVPVLADLLARGTAVLMVVSAKVELLVRTEFGALSDQLQWSDRSSFYQRLGFAYEEFRRYTAEQYAQGRRVHIIAEPDITTEIDPSSPVDRAAEYLSYEVVYNDVIAPYDCPLTCVWDARRHSTLIIENVRLLHNHEIIDGGTLVPVQHVPALDYLAHRNEIPLSTPPAATDLDLTLSSLGEIGPVHTAVRSWAGQQAFSDTAAVDIVLAVAEVATNGIVHGDAPVRVRAWRHANTLVVQVDDAGGRPLPPIAGYLSPDGDPGAGRGMWLARQLADVVKVHTAGGVTSVRLHFPHDVTHHFPVH
ncbi:anti-sigma regulatory factor (Ser/Thr protein kinase) [Krasilnikovia cinnamomea]|uniref:Anti-sigma regulatory factor (Ser/Thr protein kinase) n=1 Tax=Krasilnikovia cinnamomea TaxID=349313 RepID=A0A4Q7ZPI4_9ACTN|nr:ATP-binding protein [Krasilnikovia cinnamomea]RZU52987.1 anti-sigma regulatory factor (Ser/Thr protein kinase) [Krasilnikovia cinnamomea]